MGFCKRQYHADDHFFHKCEKCPQDLQGPLSLEYLSLQTNPFCLSIKCAYNYKYYSNDIAPYLVRQVGNFF